MRVISSVYIVIITLMSIGEEKEKSHISQGNSWSWIVSKVNYECYTNVSYPLLFNYFFSSFVHVGEYVKAED